jgi:hypothetical protein
MQSCYFTLIKPPNIQFSVVADYCRRHHEELEVIPMGRQRGWPDQIDFDHLHVYVTISFNFVWSHG